MDVSRREVVKAAGITAAAVGLSAVACGSEEQEPETKGTASATTIAEPCKHTVRVTMCGQYVVVESSNDCDRDADPRSKRRTFRGRVEARWGDDIAFENETSGQVKIYFPEIGIFSVPPERSEVILPPRTDKATSTTLKLGASKENVGAGVYEYAVAYEKAILGDDRHEDDKATWGLAIGGSSPVIDIRI